MTSNIDKDAVNEQNVLKVLVRSVMIDFPMCIVCFSLFGD